MGRAATACDGGCAPRRARPSQARAAGVSHTAGTHLCTARFWAPTSFTRSVSDRGKHFSAPPRPARARGDWRAWGAAKLSAHMRRPIAPADSMTTCHSGSLGKRDARRQGARRGASALAVTKWIVGGLQVVRTGGSRRLHPAPCPPPGRHNHAVTSQGGSTGVPLSNPAHTALARRTRVAGCAQCVLASRPCARRFRPRCRVLATCRRPRLNPDPVH